MAERDILVFVEEASAAEVARAMGRKLGIASRILVLTHQGAGDLERSLRGKIEREPGADTKFLILRDADNKDCEALKRALIERVPMAKRRNVKVRIACQELEAWYLAQPDVLDAAGALRKKLPGGALRVNPDSLTDPKKILTRHTHKRGQIELAKLIGPRLDPDSKRSRSFCHFVAALRALAALP